MGSFDLSLHRKTFQQPGMKEMIRMMNFVQQNFHNATCEHSPKAGEAVLWTSRTWYAWRVASLTPRIILIDCWAFLPLEAKPTKSDITPKLASTSRPVPAGP